VGVFEIFMLEIKASVIVAFKRNRSLSLLWWKPIKSQTFPFYKFQLTQILVWNKNIIMIIRKALNKVEHKASNFVGKRLVFNIVDFITSFGKISHLK
jgi:hypothetical protein